MIRNTNSTFTDLLEIDILEFKKVPGKGKSDLATWLRFLNTDDKEELDQMTVRSEAFKSAVCKYMELTYNEAIRMLDEENEKAWKDRKAEINCAMEEGRHNREIEIAKKMLLKNKNIEEIIDFTDLTKEEIEKLR